MIATVLNFVVSTVALAAVFGAPIVGCMFVGEGVAKAGRPADYGKIGCGVLFFVLAGAAALYLSGAMIIFK